MKPNQKLKWKNIVKELENGKSLDEATKEIPMAVKPKAIGKRYNYKQRRAIKRSYKNG